MPVTVRNNSGTTQCTPTCYQGKNSRAIYYKVDGEWSAIKPNGKAIGPETIRAVNPNNNPDQFDPIYGPWEIVINIT